jgi:hypothetical protein
MIVPAKCSVCGGLAELTWEDVKECSKGPIVCKQCKPTVSKIKSAPPPPMRIDELDAGTVLVSVEAFRF